MVWVDRAASPTIVRGGDLKSNQRLELRLIDPCF